MKKLLQAAGLLTAGATSLCHASSLSAGDPARPWSVSASIKGFYDDNIYGGPKGPGKIDSFGIDLSPSVRVTLPMDQTQISAGYQFNARWYEARDKDEWDFYHAFNANLSHTFSPRFRVDLSEAFAIAQEPEQLGSGAAAATPFRSPFNNIVNHASVDFTFEVTRTLSGVLYYKNDLYDFSDKEIFIPGYGVLPGYGPVMDRMEHAIGLDGRVQFTPKTVGHFGYEFGISDYDKRNESDHLSHYIFAGVDHNFTSQLIGSVRGGVEITTFGDIPEFDEFDEVFHRISATDVAPRAEASITYRYMAGSSVAAGAFHRRVATDVIAAFGSDVTDAQVTGGYVNVVHAITPKLRANLMAQYQSASYRFASHDVKNGCENYFTLGAGISYAFTPWLAAEANYYFDNRDSKITGGGYDYNRNRFFIGLRFTY